MSTVWTTLSLVRWTTGYLDEKGVPEPRLTAELLLAGVLGCRRIDLYLQFERPLEATELADFKARLKRRVAGEPLQYIEGVAYFRELRLKVDRRALIPRPETELLVGEVLGWSAGRSGLDVLDVGTGTGAIALSLRKEGDFGRIVATDISGEALSLAAENLEHALPGSVLELREGGGYQPVAEERFDVIVSNPPYIAFEERESLPREVVEWEPARALFAESLGLAVISELVGGAPGHLKAGGLLALEIGAAQAGAVAEMVRGNGSFGEPCILQDLSGRDRMVMAELQQAGTFRP